MWSGAILAGGQARRLGGRDKSALLVEGVSILDRQLASLRGVADTIVLVGFRGSYPAPCPVVDDLRPGTGPLGALFTALATATTDRVLVVAGDMPYVTAAFFKYLAEVDPASSAVIPETDGRWHPLCAMYARSAAGFIEAALDRGERAVTPVVAGLKPHLVGGDELARFDADGQLLANLNTPGDLMRWRAQSAAPDGGKRTAPPETSQTTTR
jgi:molybdenum cofactor guanylyltransferase